MRDAMHAIIAHETTALVQEQKSARCLVVIFEKGIPLDIQNGASYVSPVVDVDDISTILCHAPFLQNNGVGQM